MSLFRGASPIVGFPALAALPWHTDLAAAYAAARRALEAESEPAQALTNWLTGLSDKEMEYLLDRSTERNSHFKWCLGGGRRDYLLWLHQYKPPEQFGAQ